MLSNTNNSSQHYSFVCTQLNIFKDSKGLHSSIWPIDGTLTAITTPGQCNPANSDNGGILRIQKSSRTGASPAVGFVSYPGHLLCVCGGLIPLQAGW